MSEKENGNFVLSRGKVYFAEYKPGTEEPRGERYIGNTPVMSIKVESDQLDHYSSDQGLKEKDDSVTLMTKRSANFETDNIHTENLSMFYFGTVSPLTVAGGAIVAAPVNNVEPGLYYQLGTSPSNPGGARNISIVVVKVGVATKTLGTDYEVDLALGRIKIVPGGTIPVNSDLLVDYTETAYTRDRVLSGNIPKVGAMRVIAFNAAGVQRDYFLPKVKITPNGDQALKGDEWQKLSFNVEVLRKDNTAAIVIDGRPA